jgi:hypothetical protein
VTVTDFCVALADVFDSKKMRKTVDKIPTESKLPVLTWVAFFLILVCEAIGTAATPVPLCQPQVIVKMIVEKQMECRLAGETEVLGENIPQRHFCPSQNPT